MSDSKKLSELYRAIPFFACKPGCSDCCGVVPIAKSEWQAIKLAKREAGADCLTCEYLIDSKCSIYKDRPFLCRLYGATTDAKMACPHGCGPEKPLSMKQAKILTDKYSKLMGPAPAAFTVDIGRIMPQGKSTIPQR